MNYKEAHRKAVESMYDGLCTITEKKPGEKDELTGIVATSEDDILVDQPCRLSYRSSETVEVVNGVAVQSQAIKLFISPDIEIKPGSKVTVTQNNQTAEYKRSGVPTVYESHQEINLVLFDKWA